MSRGPEIRFLPFAERRVAYAVTGAGPALVAPAWWISHLELDWGDEAFRDFWESVSEGYTLVLYDRMGVGMSDRDVRAEDQSLDRDVDVLRALIDELSVDEVVLVGGSSGGCAAIAFAARFPQRVRRLLLYGAYVNHVAGRAERDRRNRALALGTGVAVAGRHVLGRLQQRRAGALGALPARRGEP